MREEALRTWAEAVVMYEARALQVARVGLGGWPMAPALLTTQKVTQIVQAGGGGGGEGEGGGGGGGEGGGGGGGGK